MALRRRIGTALVAALCCAIAPAAAHAQYEDPNKPPPPQPPPKPTVTLAVDHEDVRYKKPIKLTGRIDPPPGPDKKVYISISTEVPGVEHSDSSAGAVKLNRDGTFESTWRPEHNARYTAVVHIEDHQPTLYSNPVTVYVDYDARTYWRPRKGGMIEALMLIRTPAGASLDYLAGRWAYFYGLRSRRDKAARRLFRARIYYTRDDSNGHPAAYAKRRVSKPSGVKYMFSCVPNKKPVMWGRPDDPFQTRCGRSRFTP